MFCVLLPLLGLAPAEARLPTLTKTPIAQAEQPRRVASAGVVTVASQGMPPSGSMASGAVLVPVTGPAAMNMATETPTDGLAVASLAALASATTASATPGQLASGAVTASDSADPFSSLSAQGSVEMTAASPDEQESVNLAGTLRIEEQPVGRRRHQRLQRWVLVVSATCSIPLKSDMTLLKLVREHDYYDTPVRVTGKFQVDPSLDQFKVIQVERISVIEPQDGPTASATASATASVGDNATAAALFADEYPATLTAPLDEASGTEEVSGASATDEISAGPPKDGGKVPPPDAANEAAPAAGTGLPGVASRTLAPGLTGAGSSTAPSAAGAMLGAEDRPGPVATATVASATSTPVRGTKTVAPTVRPTSGRPVPAPR